MTTTSSAGSSGGTSKNPREISTVPLLSRAEVAGRITNGALLIIYQSNVINVTSWAPHHPGGALALLHFVGRDATDEIEAYHPVYVLQRMERFVVGKVEIDEEEGWAPLTPPIALGLVRHLDDIKGHWAKEGKVTLAESILQQGISLDPLSAPIPATPTSTLRTSIGSKVITLHPAQLEPASSNLDRRTEHLRANAFKGLKLRINEAGLFDCPGPLAGYGSDVLRYTLLGGAAFSLFFL